MKQPLRTINPPLTPIRRGAGCPSCGGHTLAVRDGVVLCTSKTCPDPNHAHAQMRTWYRPPPDPSTVPVGTMIGHPVDRPLPEGWVRPRGQHLAADLHPELAAMHAARGGDLTAPIILPDHSDMPTYALRVK